MAVSDSTHADGSEVSEPRFRLPHQALYAIAAGLVVVAIVLVVMVLNRDTTTGPSTTLPPPATPSATAIPSPTPTSPEERAAADATAAFLAYNRALDEVGHAGGDKAAVAKAARLTTKDGTERAYLTKTSAKELRDGKFRTTGWSKVTTRVDAVELGFKPPRVDLATCVDQRDIKVTKDGKPFAPPKFLRYGVVLHLVDGQWLVDEMSNMTGDLKPMELTSCEP